MFFYLLVTLGNRITMYYIVGVNKVKMMSITSVRLSDDLEKPLDALAHKLDRSRSYLINQAVREFVARQAVEESRWQETLCALESIKSGNAISEDTVHSWLNSWGSGLETNTPAKK